MRSTTLSVLLIISFAVIGVACSGSNDSPTAPSAVEPVAAASLELVEADLTVGGQSVSGMTLSPGHGNGQPTVFRARLMSNGQPAPGHEVWVQFERPMGMGMMGGSDGLFRLYDDGTHGDQIPADGIYCLRDVEAQYGCNGTNMQQGEYHYEFWGQQQGGPQSNHLHVRVWLGQD